MIGADFSGVNILMLVKFLCQELGRDVHSPGTSLGGGGGNCPGLGAFIEPLLL